MNRTPIPNCPQEDKPIRDRAWTDGQAALADYWIIEYENGDLKVMRHPPRDPSLYKSVTPVVAIGATP